MVHRLGKVLAAFLLALVVSIPATAHELTVVPSAPSAVEYYISALAAPAAPQAGLAPSKLAAPWLQATLEFDVLGAAAPIPALRGSLLALLAAALAAAALFVLRR